MSEPKNEQKIEDAIDSTEPPVVDDTAVAVSGASSVTEVAVQQPDLTVTQEYIEKAQLTTAQDKVDTTLEVDYGDGMDDVDTSTPPDTGYVRVEQNTLQEAEVFYEGKWNDQEETLPLPSDEPARIRAVITNTPAINLTNSPSGDKWRDVLQSGNDLTMTDDQFSKQLEEEGRTFQQVIRGKGANDQVAVLAGGHPKFKELPNQILVGEAAVLRAMSYAKMGTIFQVPLWHTGIWLTLKAPSESVILEFFRLLTEDKINIGRQTGGYVFANEATYTTDRMVTLALNHLYDTTYSDRENLKSVILAHDIYSLIWGFANVIWNSGFQYRRACVSDPEKCNHVVEERINLAKTLWVDNSSLTPWQVAHMSNRRANSMTADSVKKYQAEMLVTKQRTFDISSDSDNPINVTVKVPTIADQIRIGHAWIGGIEDMLTRALGIEPSDDARNNFVFENSRASAMRTYEHYVQTIDFGGNSVEDPETISSVLEKFSADDYMRNTFIEQVNRYAQDASIAVVGIPVYDCPNCGKSQAPKKVLPRHTNIIPLNVYKTFFYLLVQKVRRIRSR
jgi:hypothetical protein